jgi:hypothetical protein
MGLTAKSVQTGSEVSLYRCLVEEISGIQYKCCEPPNNDPTFPVAYLRPTLVDLFSIKLRLQSIWEVELKASGLARLFRDTRMIEARVSGLKVRGI